MKYDCFGSMMLEKSKAAGRGLWQELGLLVRSVLRDALVGHEAIIRSGFNIHFLGLKFMSAIECLKLF